MGQTVKRKKRKLHSQALKLYQYSAQKSVRHTRKKKGKNQNRSLPVLDPGTSKSPDIKAVSTKTNKVTKKFLAKPGILHPTQKLAQH